MAFNCSYRSLNEQNIRHIYSDQKLRIIFPKRTHFRSLQEELPVPPLRLYPKKFYDYYPAYNIGLPRAPAFRGTDRQHVDQIVERICQPMRCHKEGKHGSRHRRRHRRHQDDDNDEDVDKEFTGDEEKEEGATKELTTPKLTPRDMEALISRLQRPTQSWEKKKYDRDEREREKERENRETSLPKLPPIPSRV